MRRGGLYQVTDGVYQARNNDIANLTIVEGDGGLVVDIGPERLLGARSSRASRSLGDAVCRLAGRLGRYLRRSAWRRIGDSNS
jgi:hypothetical protein